MNTQPNPAQATGTVTSYEQSVSNLLAKQQGAKAEDFIAPSVTGDTDENGFPIEEAEQLQEGEPEADQDENAENVSADDSQEQEQEPDERPIILADGSEITVEEARKGYIRQSDYTRKTQAIAAEKESLTAQHNAAMQQVSGLYQQLASLQERPPTPDEMMQLARTKTPEEFQQIQAYWQYKTTVMGQAEKAIQQAQAQAKQAAMAKAFEVLNAGEYEPTWRDQKALTAGLEKVTSYVAENYPGLPAELLSEVVWPETIIMIDKARRFDELQKAKPKAALAVKGKPAPFKPGAKSTASPQAEGLKLLQEKFRNNPSMENGIALERARASLRKPGLRQ